MFADYNYYKNTFGGSQLTTDNYPRFAAKATIYINKVTFDRIVIADDAIKMCQCEIAELMYRTETSGGIKQSESIGGYAYSVSSTSLKSLEGLQMDICKAWLNTELLYRGVR